MPSKVMKFQLYYVDGSSGDFSFVQQSLWGLMRDSREILNKTIQYCVQWDFKDRLHYEETGEHLDIVAETGKKRLDGHIYSILKDKYTACNTGILNATIKKAFDKYKGCKKDVVMGTMSIPSYKSDQPICLFSQSMKKQPPYFEGGEWLVRLSMFSNPFKKENGLKTNPLFRIKVGDKSQRTILERIESGEYSIGASQLVYRKKKWFLYLTYTFESRETALDLEKILGVDLGVAYVLYASTKGVYGGFSIQGREAHVRPDGRKVKTNVLEYAEQLEQQTWDRQKQARYCGEGRIGHGTRKRLEPVYQAGKRLANHRDTLNHRWSKALVEYALKTGCGTIQMEDLTGIKEDTGFPKMLRHWTYYDLQQKIEYKAEEKGIKVVKVNPKYTSQRCSQCGYIDKGNRPDQKTFQCLKCGFKHNADYNASQNLSIKNIDKIIAKELKKKGEPQADTE
jgi:IS605 OrfB family transposase